MRGLSPYMGGQQTPGAYTETYRCPHGFVSNEHRSWGQNLEQPWVEVAWAQGYGTAYARMLEEAGTLGAHGVIGVADRVSNVADTGTTEFHFLGTAVTVEGGPPPAGGVPWSTYLAGQRLTKSIEAGFMPVAVVAALASVRVWAYCMTEYYMEGGMGGWGMSGGPALVEQVSKAHMASRQLARKHVRTQLAGDELHGAMIDVVTRELSAGDEVIDCTLRGNRVRRFKDWDPIVLPRPTVRLS
jgi:Putative heavy-metal-binding